MMTRSTAWRCASLCAGLICIVFAFSGPAAFATFPGTDGRITYSAGNAQISTGIFTVFPDGSGTTRLTAPHTFDPAWSPDGRRLLFVRDGDPSGQRIDFDIFMGRVDGSRRRITDTPNLNETDPSFAPGGKRIVFSQTIGEQHPALVSMRLDGSHRHRLIEARGHAFGGRAFRGAEYSPDGDHIVYEHQKAIWVARADFSRTKQVTDPTDRDYAPDWSPDGDQIAFTSCLAYSSGGSGCYYETEVMSPTGKHRHRVRCGQFYGHVPGRAVFAPSNGSIAVAWPGHLRIQHVPEDRSCPDFEMDTNVGALDWQPLPSG